MIEEQKPALEAKFQSQRMVPWKKQFGMTNSRNLRRQTRPGKQVLEPLHTESKSTFSIRVADSSLVLLLVWNVAKCKIK